MLFLAEKNGGRGVAGGNDGDDFGGGDDVPKI